MAKRLRLSLVRNFKSRSLHLAASLFLCVWSESERKKRKLSLGRASVVSGQRVETVVQASSRGRARERALHLASSCIHLSHLMDRAAFNPFWTCRQLGSLVSIGSKARIFSATSRRAWPQVTSQRPIVLRRSFGT